MISPQRIDLSAPTMSVPLFVYEPASEALANLIILPALGVPARFYSKLAEAAANAGFRAVLVEQRGHGESPIRPSRMNNWGFKETVSDDLPAVIEWVRERDQTIPLYLAGHSLGGHYAAMIAGLRPEAADGIILIACASPYIEAFAGRTKLSLRFLHLAIPASAIALGVYPGDRIGFGGREARGVMADWLALSKTNRYGGRGLPKDIDERIADYHGSLFVLKMARDPFAPEAGVRAVVDKFKNARIAEKKLTESDIGDHADHFRWAKTPLATVRELLAFHEDVKTSRFEA